VIEVMLLREYNLRMNKQELIKLIQQIVSEGVELKNKHTDLHEISVNYACVFAHNENEYEVLNELVQSSGEVRRETEMGSIYLVDTISTVAGKLQLVKVRKPEETKPGKGYADFTV
jgi:hypothetical protein